MIEEYTFRGVSVELDTFVYGGYVYNPFLKSHYIVSPNPTLRTMMYIQVYSDSIVPFIGYDKNGTPIFMYDRVRDEDGYEYTIDKDSNVYLPQCEVYSQYRGDFL